MSGPPPAVAAVRVAVRRALADVEDGATVLVACSGGADSLALAAGLAWEAAVRARAGRPLRAGAVVVDHGLQDGSHDVAQDAADACRALGLEPVRVVRVEVGAAGGPEGPARTARYAALGAAADAVGAAAVLLGHTLDDQAETVLLALARGSGERALAGMRPVRGRWRRPLLGLRRVDTEAACAAQALVPWHDPTNGRPVDGGATTGAGAGEAVLVPVVPGAGEAVPSPGDPAVLPLRSRVRVEVLPLLERVLGPGVAQALARTADALADATDVVDDAAARLLAAARVGPPADPVVGRASDRPGATADGVVLDVATLAAALPGTRRRALHDAALAAGCPAGALTRAHVLAVEALVLDWHGQGPVHLPGGRVATRACGRLYLDRPTRPAGAPDISGGALPAGRGAPAARHDDHDDQE
ncbi:tRNA lysidine(34) synthetase TilS [Cellulomonas iranensis]|uniref:tRNA lysidine(34) synthetase TilS n=1 Tax=Cellulomonas iranensis TaxID=76862 RepID=UPI001C4FD642|nr:tRNA lysidine(34) synthetase TilS [Cellulomonas iranensis]